jgi:hypothetical protein
MFDAQYLFNPSTGTAFTVFGPWMSRGGDNATFFLDLLAQNMAPFSGLILSRAACRGCARTNPFVVGDIRYV